MRFAVPLALLTVCGLHTASQPAQAQAQYPTRHVTLVVPFAAGGPNDVMSRIVAGHMSRTLGQTVIVENVSGAGGTIGAARVASSAPDGYTLVSGHVGTHAAAPALYPNLRYDPVADFVPVGLVAETPILIATKRELPVTTFATFASLAKERGAGLTMGHAGVGSISQISCLLLNAALGIKPTEVAFRGSAPAMTDLLAGHYDVTCALLVDALPYLASDQLRFLAVSAPARVPQAPTVPTASEAGLPQFVASSWFAFFLPRATPDAIRDRLAAALQSALDDASVRGRLETAGLIVPAAEQRTREAFRHRLKADIERWSEIVRNAKIQLGP